MLLEDEVIEPPDLVGLEARLFFNEVSNRSLPVLDFIVAEDINVGEQHF